LLSLTLSRWFFSYLFLIHLRIINWMFVWFYVCTESNRCRIRVLRLYNWFVCFHMQSYSCYRKFGEHFQILYSVMLFRPRSDRWEIDAQTRVRVRPALLIITRKDDSAVTSFFRERIVYWKTVINKRNVWFSFQNASSPIDFISGHAINAWVQAWNAYRRRATYRWVIIIIIINYCRHTPVLIILYENVDLGDARWISPKFGIAVLMIIYYTYKIRVFRTSFYRWRVRSILIREIHMAKCMTRSRSDLRELVDGKTDGFNSK